MVTPALLISATGSLVLSTSTRLGRVVDRVRQLEERLSDLIYAEDKTIYHAGDTALFLDMQLIGQLNTIDVALLPIGDNFTMGIDDAIKAIEFLKPRITVPMHCNTFELIKADPTEFQRKAMALDAEVRILEVGGTLSI